MPLFDDKVKKQLTDILAKLKEKVTLMYFTHEMECGACKDTHGFLQELTELSDKLGLSVFDFVKDREKADYYKVDKVPAIVVLDREDNDTRMKFYGLPGGYEINSFIESVFEASGAGQPLPPALSQRIANIKKDVHIQVFVSLS
jgi:alkyl hydroperoxide reductase subunit AhpF